MDLLGLSWDERAAAALPWRRTRVAGVSWIPLHLESDAHGSAGASAATGTTGATGASETPAPSGSRGAACVLIRMEPGAGYAPHRHVGCEDVLVLAGGYADEWGSYRQGQHVHYPAGSVHAPRALGSPDRPAGPSNPACVLYSVVPEGIELLSSSPRPRSSRA